MMDLNTSLLKFRDYTTALIFCLDEGNYDSLEGLLDQRQAIIDEIDNATYNKELFQKLSEEYDIINLNSKMNSIMSEKLEGVKSEIKKINLQKNLNTNYTMSTTVDSLYFNKKI